MTALTKRRSYVTAWKDSLKRKIEERNARVHVIGLGYVGLSLAVELARAGFTVRGIDVDLERVARLNHGQSYLVDVPTETLTPLVSSGRLTATTAFDEAGQADALIICVPTPLRKSKEPDISFIVASLESLLPHLHHGQLLVLERPTCRGPTGEFVQPRLQAAGLVVGVVPFLSFPPERVEPGNRKFTPATIPKVVGGVAASCPALAACLYRHVTTSVFEA